MTNLSNDKQREYFVGNCCVLITPSLNNCHSFDIISDGNIEQESINADFKKLLDDDIDWDNYELSFGMIPEKQLSLVQDYWNKHRNDQYKISYHCNTNKI